MGAISFAWPRAAKCGSSVEFAIMAPPAAPRGLCGPRAQPDKACHCLPRGGDQGLSLMEAATATAPERAALQFEAGQAYASHYEQELARLEAEDEQEDASP